MHKLASNVKMRTRPLRFWENLLVHLTDGMGLHKILRKLTIYVATSALNTAIYSVTKHNQNGDEK